MLITLHQFSLAQQETYTVTKARFSSDKYDEFCPVYYKNGIVFCTNRRSSSLVDYSSEKGIGPVNIYYIDTTGKMRWRKSRSFSKSLNSNYNDGPVTFNTRGDTIYYSRNQRVEGKLRELSTVSNKLGIFSAVLGSKDWTQIRELRYNNEWYNISTPCLSPDGKRLYFASDKPDGYGGSDLYYCEWKNNYLTDPVNLGPEINTPGNESYPFITPAGELFFSSDQHKSLGGKDIFFSRVKDGKWIPPIRLDPPINSKYDDFGIITDSLMSEGYFSSGRDRSLDIFRFKTNIPQIFYTDIQKENQYCFSFGDEGEIEVDTLNLRYLWDFGDGKKAAGAKVNHCFPGPGKYKIKLDLVDIATGNLFFSMLEFGLELKDYEQPYINSPAMVITGDTVEFDGLRSFLPGYEILSYSWDFGDGSRMLGKSVKYTFKQKGEFNVNLGLKLKSLSTGIIHNTGVSKKITVFDTNQEKASFLAERASANVLYPDIRKYDNALIKTIYSAETEFKQGALFEIELLKSKSSIGIGNIIFKRCYWKVYYKGSF